MPSITRTYPAAWVARMEPAVQAKFEEIRRHQVVEKLLTLRGVTVEELTAVDKAEILIDFMFWETVAAHEGAEAREAAFHNAVQQAIDDFTVGEE